MDSDELILIRDMIIEISSEILKEADPAGPDIRSLCEYPVLMILRIYVA